MPSPSDMNIGGENQNSVTSPASPIENRSFKLPTFERTTLIEGVEPGGGVRSRFSHIGTLVVRARGSRSEAANPFSLATVVRLTMVCINFSGVLRWLGRSISAAFDFVGAVIKGMSSIVGGIISGLIRILGGILSLDWSLIRDGLIDIVSGFLGGLIIIVGKLISFVQTVSYFLQPNKRKLTAEEKRLLRRVFRKSLALYNIRLVEG